MAHNTGRSNSNRSRIAREGGPSRNPIHFGDDSYRTVQAREGVTLKYGPSGGFAVPSQAAVTVVDSNEAWLQAMSWAPAEDNNYALDSSGDGFDEAVEGDVMEDRVPLSKETGPSAKTTKAKKPRSEVAKRPNKVWKRLHRSTYLDEILRHAGRGDYRGVTQCMDCLAYEKPQAGPAEFRCESECFVPELTCRECCVRRHKRLPFHRIQRWDGRHFLPVTLKSLGLKVTLNHSGNTCSVPIPCHTSMVVIHTNGFHDVDIQFCGCGKGESPHIQLLRRRLYPATQRVIQTCATFELLEHLHKFALTTKAATYDFYRGLEKLTNNTGIDPPSSRYRPLMRMIVQWRHLMLLKWGGRAHDPGGPDGTKPGDLAIRCPSCPRPGVNLPEGWEKAPEGMKFLYMLFACMDANFRLKNQLVSNYSQDPGLGPGLAYMLPREEYEGYVKSIAKEDDFSTCVGFQALAKANTRFSQGLRYTGVGGAFCGRTDMIFPSAIGNLQKGERYANMDYVFASAIQDFSSISRDFSNLITILISYDIACQWFINLFKRLNDNRFPKHMRPSPTSKFVPAIPKLHEPMHQQDNHQVYSLNLIPGAGSSDLETPERVWSGHNALGNSTKTAGPGFRSDTLDDHFSWWNYLKFIGMGMMMSRRYRAAMANRNIQVEAHRGLTKSLDKDVVARWEKMCVEYEQDSFPKTKKNPYQTDGIATSEAEVRREMLEEEERKLAKARLSGPVPTPTSNQFAFITTGLDIEESQRRLQRLAQDLVAQATAKQEGGLFEQRNQLMLRINLWEQLLPIYMPGLQPYRERTQTEPTTPNTAPFAETRTLWLPSLIPSEFRGSVCQPGLARMEEKLRNSQCTDSLDTLRHTLKMKTRLIYFKNANIRGQRDGTRSRAIIDRVHEKARVAALKYRNARSAKMALAGPGGWEKKFQVLLNEDIRTYQDPTNPKKSARKGTLEDEQVDDDEMLPDPPAETDDFSLVAAERSKRDGTGETRKALSWIWVHVNGPTKEGEGEGDDILMVEWCKSRARAARAREEVLLLREEMRRILASMEWKAKQWLSRIGKRVVGVDAALEEGLTAYAHKQALYQMNLANIFRGSWLAPLKDFKPEDLVRPEDDDEEVEEDDEDDESDLEDDEKESGGLPDQHGEHTSSKQPTADVD